MNFTALYLMEKAFRRGAVQLAPASTFERNMPDTDLANGQWTPDRRLKFKQVEGSRWTDIVGTTLAVLNVVSERLFDTFERAHLKGWDSLPIEIEDRNGEPVPGYRLLVVKGRCGPIDHMRSVEGTEDFGNPNGPSKVWRGFYFEDQSWSGDDFFCPEKTSFVFVSQRAKDMIVRLKATNVVLTPLTDVRNDRRAVYEFERGKL